MIRFKCRHSRFFICRNSAHGCITICAGRSEDCIYRKVLMLGAAISNAGKAMCESLTNATAAVKTKAQVLEVTNDTES